MTKFDESGGDPRGAYKQVLATAAVVAKGMGDALAGMKSEHPVETAFSMKITSNGDVMVAQTPEIGQFRITIKVLPQR
ncbi:MAG: hypothetical protein HN348_26080, partial [Proteobacteria bacterium]|nr:hypothetical protein [Pseudomonadota bacterium]